jgi:hypothetical protein
MKRIGLTGTIAAIALATAPSASAGTLKTIEGPTAKLPRDRLLRVAFGLLVRPGGQYNTELSTTHQFKLPRRL